MSNNSNSYGADSNNPNNSNNSNTPNNQNPQPPASNRPYGSPPLPGFNGNPGAASTGGAAGTPNTPNIPGNPGNVEGPQPWQQDPLAPPNQTPKPHQTSVFDWPGTGASKAAGSEPAGASGPQLGPQPGPSQSTPSSIPSSNPSTSNPYGGPSSTLADTQKPPAEKRTIGIVPAAVLALVAAVVAGSITGIYATRWSDSSTQSVAESLQEPASKGKPKAEAGTVQAVAENVQPSVVSIQLLTSDSAVSGSGSIISSDGYVLTNNHVVKGAANGGANMTVTLKDGSTHKADFVAGDDQTDVAVIKVQDVKDMPTIKMGNSDDLAVGQPVVAIGAPLGLDQTVTTGIVSALNRPVRAGEGGESTIIDAIQTDAAINPGNSGGPLVNMDGELIGMNSVIASTNTSGSEEAGSIGVGFAIPANFSRRTADQLIKDGKASYPLIGVSLDQRFRDSGAKIAEVSKDGPGDKAGLKKGEVVVAINDRVIKSANGLIAAVRSSDFGAKIKLKVVDEQGNNPREVEVTLPNE